MDRTTELLAEGARPRGAPHAPGSAREVLAGNLGRDPWEGIEDLRAAGNDKARAEGVAYELDKTRDAVLARIANEIASAQAGNSLSEAKLERLAKADPRYAEHIRKTAEAVAERERLTARYYAIKAELEWDEEAVRHMNHMSRLGG